ncbi:MAG: NAD(P)/FAD-dependent oxidoreductase [Acidobacteriota bacterium]|nr:NAD(P)/FAD-dependent oxidoreductase [Acidobacteriota bacterium]
MSPPRQQHWAIAGGGLLGMTLAWDLANEHRKITLFESAPSPGGLASAWRLGDIVWDRHYHVTLLSDSALRGLLSELDLDKEMRWTRTRTGFYGNGRLHPFSGALEFVRFPLLNPIEKLLFALAVLHASRLRSPESIEALTVEQWLTRISGKSVFRKIWLPLLRAKLGENYRTTSATFIWATIQRLYAARRSGLREELFGYLPGGYSRMLETFAAALRRKGVAIELNSRIREIRTGEPSGVTVSLDNSSALFDRVIVTTPAPIAAKLCPQLTSHEARLLNGVHYEGIICASMLLRRPLSDFYITNIADSSIPLTGVIEMSSLVDREMFGGRALVYLPRYLPPEHPAFDCSDDDLKAEFLSAVRLMHPLLKDDEIVAFRISRARHVYPRPTPGSAARAPLIDTSIPGVHILNSANIPAGTLNVNETVQLARREAKRLDESARSPHDLAA